MALLHVKKQYFIYNGVAATTITFQYAMGNGAAGTGRKVHFFLRGDQPDSVTYNGVPLATIDTDTSPFCRLYISEDSTLPADTSDHDLVFTYPAGRTNQGVLVSEWSGAKQLGAIPPGAAASSAAGATHPVTFNTTVDGVTVECFYLRIEDRTMTSQPAGTVLHSDSAGVVYDGQRIIAATGPTPAGAATFTFDSSGNSNGAAAAVQIEEEPPAGGTEHAGSAAWSGAGAFSASGAVRRVAAVAVVGAGLLTLAGTRSLAGGAVVGGAGTFAASGSLAKPGALVASGVGTLSASAGVLRGAALAVSGAGALGLVGALQLAASLAWSGAGLFDAAGVLGAPRAQRYITGKVGMRPLVTGHVASRPVVSGVVRARPLISGVTTMPAQIGVPVLPGVPVIHAGAAAWSGAGTFDANGVLASPSGLVLSGAGLLALAGQRVRAAAWAASGAGTFTANGDLPAVPGPDTIAGLFVWHRVDDLALADNDPIATLADLSGNGRHLTAAGAAQPTYKAAILNGYAIARFDGGANAFSYADNTFVGLTAAEIFVVMKLDADPPANVNQSGLWTITGSSFSAHHPYIDGVIYDDFASTVRKTTGNPATPLTNWVLYNVASAAGAWTSRVNGVQHFTTATNSFSIRTTGLKFGENTAAHNLDGDVAEIIMYDHVLTGGDRSAVHAYLNDRYGFALP